jgi:hypothetical protein
MSTLNARLRDAGRLKDAAPIEPAPAAPELPHQVVAVEPVTIAALPPVTIAELPAPKSWVHRIQRDNTGAMVAVISTPITQAAP